MSLLTTLAPFVAEGPVMVSCERCGTKTTLGPDGENVAVLELVTWGQQHKCPVPVSPPARLCAVPA
jgi:hypothetical protein